MQIFIFSKVSSTSALVIHKLSTEFIKIAFFKATRSSHPHLLGLPVVAPNSFPRLAISSPSSSKSSVINGPSPTLVAYALTIPITLLICFGPIPRPDETPPIVVLDEVT